MRVIICHGKESSPESSKLKLIQQIANEAGHNVEVPDFRPDGTNPEDRLKHLLCLEFEDPTILVGSSMGGWTALAASETKDVYGMYLLAPAFGLDNYPSVNPRVPNVKIVHGLSDVVVPVENSIRLMRSFSQNPKYVMDGVRELSIVEDNHRLENSIQFLNKDFQAFLTHCTAWYAGECGAT
jgi:predicted alpha/beta hydrolase family esterase